MTTFSKCASSQLFQTKQTELLEVLSGNKILNNKLLIKKKDNRFIRIIKECLTFLTIYKPNTRIDSVVTSITNFYRANEEWVGEEGRIKGQSLISFFYKKMESSKRKEKYQSAFDAANFYFKKLEIPQHSKIEEFEQSKDQAVTLLNFSSEDIQNFVKDLVSLKKPIIPLIQIFGALSPKFQGNEAKDDVEKRKFIDLYNSQAELLQEKKELFVSALLPLISPTDVNTLRSFFEIADLSRQAVKEASNAQLATYIEHLSKNPSANLYIYSIFDKLLALKSPQRPEKFALVLETCKLSLGVFFKVHSSRYDFHTNREICLGAIHSALKNPAKQSAILTDLYQSLKHLEGGYLALLPHFPEEAILPLLKVEQDAIIMLTDFIKLKELEKVEIALDHYWKEKHQKFSFNNYILPLLDTPQKFELALTTLKANQVDLKIGKEIELELENTYPHWFLEKNIA